MDYKRMNAEALKAIQHGDMKTIQTLYKPLLTNVCRSFKLKDDTINDMIQETMIKVWLNHKKLKTDKIGGWIYQIAVNTILAYFNDKNKISTYDNDVSDMIQSMNVSNADLSTTETLDTIKIF
jgi:RNA polymerase sigma factor (sigma-70 family)